MKRIWTSALVGVLSLSMATPAVGSDNTPSIKRSLADIQAVSRADAGQARPNAPNQSSDNPYFLPAVILLAAGGVVTLYGMTHDTGVACTTGTTSFSCGTTKSKAVIFGGIGMIGVGAFLLYKGKNSPQITFGPRAIGLRQQFVW